MASRDIKDLHAQLQSAWMAACALHAERFPKEAQPFLTCTHRSEAEQIELYAQGRTKPGKIVTHLKKGSKHNSLPAMAFDVAFKTELNQLDWHSRNFKRFAAIVKEVDSSISWGGNWARFKDQPHFELPY